jgi:hypothetical protein
MATMCTTCSALNLTGLPLRYSSRKLSSIASRNVACPAASAAWVTPRFAAVACHRSRHKRTVLRFGGPFWALTYGFGRDDMDWHRLVVRLGQPDIVGTTLKNPDKLPEHVLADEKHTRLKGTKAYSATTVAADCILGASLALAADESPLKEAYQPFKQEAQRLNPDDQPQTVNTDGWSPTQRAWQALFPTITLACVFGTPSCPFVRVASL